MASVQAEESWSVGAGIGFTNAPGFVAGVGGLVAGGAVGRPSFAVNVERRLASRLWLMVLADGSYGASALGDAKARSYGWGLGLGARVVALQIEAFELAPYLGVWFRQQAGRFDPEGADQPEASSRSLGAAADVGLSFQYRLVPGLYVRLLTSLASASWSEVETEVSGQPSVSATALSGGVHVSPALELRMFF